MPLVDLAIEFEAFGLLPCRLLKLAREPRGRGAFRILLHRQLAQGLFARGGCARGFLQRRSLARGLLPCDLLAGRLQTNGLLAGGLLAPRRVGRGLQTLRRFAFEQHPRRRRALGLRTLRCGL